MARRKLPNEDALARAVKYYDESLGKHNAFVLGVEERYRAYRGLLDTLADKELASKKVAAWTSHYHPPYINHIVETTLASLITDKLRYRIRPRLTVDALFDPSAAERARAGAKAHQILFDWQIRNDHFSRIQRPFCLQNAIAGLTVTKTYWTTREERRRTLVPSNEPLLDENDQQILDPTTGQPMSMPKLVEKEGVSVVYDGPTTEVVDVRDFGWHEAAVSLDHSRYVWHRAWMSKEEIEEAYAGDSPTFGLDRGGWDLETVRKLLPTSGGASTAVEDPSYREKALFNVDRTKDLIPVVEVWDQIRKELTTFANHSILLAFRPEFPFFHERTAFDVCSTQPDLFRIPGISQVEKVIDLQKMLWDLSAQRLENLRLVNNAIIWFRPDVDDPDEYEFYPGARWLVDDPNQVQMWTPNVVPAEVSVSAEASMKGDMQNLSGGFPFASGTDSQTIDQKTATGASIITSLAQRSIDLGRQQVDDAWEDVGYKRMILNQQFVREPTLATALGADDEEVLHVVMPEILQGDFDFQLEAVPDSTMRQEEQASAQALVQVVSQVLPVLGPLSQAGAARMVNMDALMEDLFRAFGKEDTERYFITKPAPAMAATGTPAGSGAGAGQQPLGITGPHSIDPAVSPSAQVSNAPSTLVSRALALSRGGARNV